MNPNDVIRRQILEWFHRRNANASSEHGKNGAAAKISEVKAGLKAHHGLTQKEVVANLTYLIDKGWVNRSEVQKTVRVKGGTVPSTVVWYVISAAGIDKIEGESEFKSNARYPGINISATGSNVIVTGDGNIVNAQFADLHAQLMGIKTLLAGSSLDEGKKLDASADIESITDQLAKSQPDRTIIARLWSRVENVATLAGFADAIQRVSPLIVRLLGA